MRSVAKSGGFQRLGVLSGKLVSKEHSISLSLCPAISLSALPSGGSWELGQERQYIGIHFAAPVFGNSRMKEVCKHLPRQSSKASELSRTGQHHKTTPFEAATAVACLSHGLGMASCVQGPPLHVNDHSYKGVSRIYVPCSLGLYLSRWGHLSAQKDTRHNLGKVVETGGSCQRPAGLLSLCHPCPSACSTFH